HFVPIEQLGRARPLDDERDEQPPSTAREMAIRAAMRGDLDASRTVLAEGGEALDLKYLANVEALRGNAEASARALAEVLTRDPEDVDALGRLLRFAVEHPDHAIAARLRVPEVRDRAIRALHTQLRERPLRPEPWRTLAAVHALFGEGADAA